MVRVGEREVKVGLKLHPFEISINRKYIDHVN